MLRNGSGYPSPVEDVVTRRVDAAAAQEADERAKQCIYLMRKMADIVGFDVLNRIELGDRRTGRRYT